MTDTATATAAVNGRQNAWRQLGTVADQDGMTAEQVLANARLGGWNVRKMPVTTTDYSTEPAITQEIEDTFAVWRDNPHTERPEVLLKGTVGAVWDPFQNEEMCDFLDALTGSSGARFDASGSLHEGRDVFVSMRLPDTMMVGGVDPVDLYMTAFNNHTGRRALNLTIGGIRVWCANQQRVVLRNAQSTFKIRHTGQMRTNALADARDALNLSFKYVDALREEADRMISSPYSDAEFDRFIIELCGDQPKVGDKVEGGKAKVSPRMVEAYDEEVGTLRHLFRDADTQENIRNTRWGAYQSVTEYLDWYVPVPAKRGGHAIEAAPVRAQRTLEGTYGEIKEAAYDLLAVS